jgi:hypothetical protein
MSKTLLAGTIATTRRSIDRDYSRHAAGALIAVATLLAATTTVSMTTTPAHAAANCILYSGGLVYGAEKRGFIKRLAQKRARKSWRAAAQNAAGTSRGGWNTARNRNVVCDKFAGRWFCRAEARPCY